MRDDTRNQAAWKPDTRSLSVWTVPYGVTDTERSERSEVQL